MNTRPTLINISQLLAYNTRHTEAAYNKTVTIPAFIRLTRWYCSMARIMHVQALFSV